MSLLDELGAVASNLPRGIGQLVGAFASDLVLEPIRTFIPGGDKGMLEFAEPQEDPDLLDDLGMEGIGNFVDTLEARSSIARDVVSPTIESLLTTGGQALGSIPSPFTKGPLPAAARAAARIAGAEVDEDAGIVESLLQTGEAAGSEVVGEFAERVAIDREEREGLTLIPIIEDVGNVALAAGGLGVAARVGGRVTGSARLTDVGRTASATARLGTTRGAGALRAADQRVSPTGQALGAIARPIRTTVGTTPLGQGKITGALRQRAYDDITRRLAEADAAGETLNNRKILEAAARLVNPRRTELYRLLGMDEQARRDYLAQVRQSLTEGAARTDAMKRLRTIASDLDADTLARVQANYGRIAEESGLDVPSELPDFGRLGKIPPEQALAVLDALAESDVPLRKDLFPVEKDFGLDVRKHSLDLVRLSLYEQVKGLDPGSLTGALRAIHEMDSLAYTVAEARPLLIEALGEEQAARVLSLVDGIEEVRLMEQTLPDLLDTQGKVRLQQAAKSYREMQAGVERARIGADLIPEANIGSRLTPEGDPLPGDAPTRFDDGPAPNAPSMRRIARLNEKLKDAKVSLAKLDKAIKESGGFENLAQVAGAAKERAAVYNAMLDALRQVTRSADLVDNPAVLDSVLSMLDDMIEIGADVDRQVIGDTPAYMQAAQKQVVDAVNDLREQVDIRSEQMAQGGTPVTRVKTNLRTLARLARNVNDTNAVESVSAMRAALDEVQALADEAGIPINARVIQQVESVIEGYDRVRNQRLTNQQRLRELLLGEEIASTPAPRMIENIDSWAAEQLGVEQPLGGPEVPNPRNPKTRNKAGVHRVRNQIREEQATGSVENGQILTGPLVYRIENYGDGTALFNNPVEVTTEPVQYVYRAVSEAEWRQAQLNGGLRSDRRGVISDWEGTNAAVTVESATSYLPRDRQGRIVKIRVEPEDGWFGISADVYARTTQDIPLDRIEGVTPVVEYRDHRYVSEISGKERTARRLFEVPEDDVSIAPAPKTLTQSEIDNLSVVVDEHLDQMGLDFEEQGALVEQFEANAHRPLYHGSIEGIQPGQVIAPGAGPTTFRNVSDPELAYATESPGDAAGYAELADANRGSDAQRGVVYEVRAIDTPFEDPNIAAGVPGVNRGDLANRYGYVVVRQISPEEARAIETAARQSGDAVDPRPPGDLPTTIRQVDPDEPTTGFFGVTDPVRNRRLVETIIEDEIRQIGTDDGSVAKMMRRIEDRLEREQVPGNHAEIMGWVRRALNSEAGKDIRTNLKTNLPKERREALKAATAVARDLVKVADGVDPLQQAFRRVDDATANLTRQRNRYLKSSNFAAEVKRARNTIKDRAKHARGVERAVLRLDEAREEFMSSPAAVPRAGRTLVTYATQVFPEVAAALRTIDDPQAARIADDLLNAPKSLEDLQNTTVVDPVTGEERALQITYTPDAPASRDPILSRRTPDRDLADRGENFSRRQKVSDRPMEEGAFDLARRQVEDTVKAQMRKQLRQDFTEQFTQSADSILKSLDVDTEGLTSQRRAEILRRHGFVEYKPHDLFGPFKQARFTDAEARWVKADIVRGLDDYLKPAGAFDQLVQNSYDPLINTWKSSVLALRPLWQVNNHLGNFALATFAGRTNVADYFRFMNTALDLQRRAKQGNVDDTLRVLKPGLGTTFRERTGRLRDSDIVAEIDFGDADGLRELFDNSLLAGELTDVRQMSGPRRAFESATDAARARGRREGAGAGDRAAGAAAAGVRGVTDNVSRLANASYRINSTIDDMNRALVYLAKGFEDPVRGRVDLTRKFDPEEGLRNSTRAFGSYNALSPFERRVLRRVFPFYAWTRHITGVLYRHLADVNEIDRTILFAHVASVMGEPNEEEALLPEWASSQIFRGYNEFGVPTFFNPRGGDPFSEGLQPLQNLGSAREFGAFLARSSGPVGSAVYENTTGLDALTATPLSGIEGPRGEAPDPGLGQQIAESIPQVTLLRDFLRQQDARARGTEPAVRADDDTPFGFTREPGASRTVMDQFLRYMGVPVSTPLPVRDIAAAERDRVSDYIRARERAGERDPSSTLDQIGSLFGR